MNKPERYGSSVILDKYLSIKEPDYVQFMEERLWDNFKDLIINKLKENDSIIVEKVFDIQTDLFETNQLQVRQDISITKLIHCRDCKKFRLSTMYENWGVCLLANDEGYGVCREVRMDSFCSWGERKEVEE